MSDGVFIPGISSKYNSQSTIEKIMSKRREKLEDIKGEQKKLEDKQKNLGEISTLVVNLDKHARKLYGVSAPFDEKVAYSSDVNIHVSVDKFAELGEHTMSIKTKAQSHRIAGKSLDKSFKVDSGIYAIGSADKVAKIKFQGGDLEQFRKVLNEQGGGVLRSSLTNDTANTRVLVLETIDTGEDARFQFDDERTKNLFKKMGFFEEIPGFSINIQPQESKFTRTKGFQEATIINNNLIVPTDHSYQLMLPQEVVTTSGLVATINIHEENKNYSVHEKSSIIPPNQPELTRAGDVEILSVQIPGEEVIHGIDPYVANQESQIAPKIIRDAVHIELITNQGTIALKPLQLQNTPTNLTFKLEDYLSPEEQLHGFVFKNNDTEKNIFVGDIHIVDNETIDGLRFTRELSKPQNVVLEFDGLEVTRKKNLIEDLVKGVKFNVLGPTDGEALIQIDRDYPKIVDALVSFLSEYNSLLDTIYTKTERVERGDVKKDDEETGRGTLTNERELRALASQLRMILMNPYETQYGAELAMLSQVGISTNAFGSRAANAEKLKGFLEYDEEKFVDQFIETMEKYPEGVKELFGRDVDNDYVFDTGIAVEINKLLKAYLDKSSGYFDRRNESYIRDIKKRDDSLDNYKKRFDDEEQKLKEQFFKMEQSAQELEDNRKKFDNFNKQ